jgi:hypothetical protein
VQRRLGQGVSVGKKLWGSRPITRMTAPGCSGGPARYVREVARRREREAPGGGYPGNCARPFDDSAVVVVRCQVHAAVDGDRMLCEWNFFFTLSLHMQDLLKGPTY